MKKIEFSLQNNLLRFLSILLLCTSACYSQSEMWEGYQVNAQFRGGIKKGFEDLGCAISLFKNLSATTKQAFFHACAKDPEKKGTYYSMRIGLVYSFEKTGDSKVIQSYYSTFEGIDGENQLQVQDVILLLGTIKDGLINKRNRENIQIGTTKISIKSDEMTSKTDRELVLICPGKEDLEVKFFLKTTILGNWTIEKFRFRRQKTVISFVCTPIEEVQEHYQTTPPFSTVVFKLP
ncbi:MAG: hypothetical protein HQM08_00675 [Candidatus Riflebacteria bacterium]|nr:hypothetical protein [Candidatus Riflebacteria bacterium]